jgi:hypothetical protein
MQATSLSPLVRLRPAVGEMQIRWKLGRADADGDAAERANVQAQVSVRLGPQITDVVDYPAHLGCGSIQMVRVSMGSLAVRSTQKLPSMGIFPTTQRKYFQRWSRHITAVATQADLNCGA